MCDTPLKGFIIGETKNGKRLYKITSANCSYVSEGVDGVFTPIYFDNGNDRPYSREVRKIVKYDMIPCGSCLACRLEKAAEWANRCMLELQYHSEACFVTLTLDDEHVTYGEYVDEETGELSFSRTLKKSDLQEFWKRLRKQYPDNNIRYYACGEYGEGTQRPHYHAIIFGYKPKDLIPFSRNTKGDPLYISEELSKIWKNGNVLVGDVTHASCNYVARYVTKKIYNTAADDEYIKKGRIPPFTTMSLKPAIGKAWYEDNKWCVEEDRTISLKTEEKGITFMAPRYFRKLFDRENDERIHKHDLTTDLKNEIMLTRENWKRSKNSAHEEDIGKKKDAERQKVNKAFRRDAL